MDGDDLGDRKKEKKEKKEKKHKKEKEAPVATADDDEARAVAEAEEERRARRKEKRAAAAAAPDVGEDGEVNPESRVRVAVRIRPQNRADHGDETPCLKVEGNALTIDNGNRTSTFTYDHIFNCTQVEVYQSIGEKMLQDAFQGYNTCIFAYGQTGSGKTYSMLGNQDSEEHQGLLPRICRELFELAQELQAEDRTLQIKIQVSFVEVYNERIRDLLQFEGKPGARAVAEDLVDLKLKEDKKTHGFTIEDLSSHTVTTYGRVRKLIEDGTKLRTMAETGMNEVSSRSHSVFTIYLHQTHDPPNPVVRDKESKITIVDLAGSERASKTGTADDPKKAKEAEKINMSLLILGRCLNACSDNKGGHIPIRESVLTKMLSDIFGGNSKTMMFATVSPAMFNFQETLSTLQYAYNAKKIKHKAKVNNLHKAIEIKELKEQVKALGKSLVEELEKAATQKENLERELAAVVDEKNLIASALRTSQEENALLRQEVDELKRELKELKANGYRAGPGERADRGDRAERGETQSRKDKQREADPDYSEAPTVGGQDDSSEEEETERNAKLQQIHDELAKKLQLINPSLAVSHSHGGDTARSMPLTARSMAGAAGTTTAPQSSSEIRSYIGHAAAVYCCDFSPQGDRMVSASRDRSLKIWSVKSGNEILTLKGHNGFVLSCCFSPSGTDVVSASDDKTLKIWDAKTGKKILTLKGHNDKVYCCTYSPKGTEIASASCDKTVKIWNAEVGKKISTLRGHASAVFCVAFSHDGKKVVSASDDKTLRVWDWAAGTELNSYQGHTGTVWSCKFSPQDDMILSASMDGTIKLWDVESSFSVRTFRGHSAPVHHAIFAAGGQKIISASRDRTLKIWDAETGKVLGTLVGHANTVYHCSVYNNLILSCSSDDILKVWNLNV